jgi:SAM-dependent methyltransferase
MSRRALRALIRRADYAVSTGRGIVSNRFVAAKLLPLAPESRYAVLTRPGPCPVDDDGLPIPPPEFWQRWGATAEEYLLEGAKDVTRMLDTLTEVGVDAGQLSRVLDFGCAEARMLRFFPRTERSVHWGVDINAERIAWAQQHLSPPLFFATTTTAPHLPFEDDYFDLVYGLSVFTHISDLADAWFLELLRILRPGGCVWLTIHDQHTVELLLGRYRHESMHAPMVEVVLRLDKDTGLLGRDWVYFTVLADPAAQVFYDADWLVSKWSRLADCLTVKPEATGYQTALVFRKPARSAA